MEESLEKVEQEKDALKETVRQREGEILKHLNVIEEKENIENEMLEKYSTVQQEIELRDLKAMQSYNNNNNNNRYDDEKKSGNQERKEHQQQKQNATSSSSNHTRLLAIDRQKVTDMTKAMRQLARQLQAEKRKLHEKEKALTE